MSAPPPAQDAAPSDPLVLRAAASLWLLTVLACLALGILAVTSLVTLAQDPPLTPAVPGAGAARALIALLGVTSAAVEVGFAAVALARAFPLRRPGTPGRRARTVLTVLAAAGVAATTIGYLVGGSVPFATGQSLHDLVHDSLETLWALAALTATALSFTPTARRHLQVTEHQP